MVDILAAIFSFSKSSIMPAQHHLDYLSLKHHPTTKLSINNYIQNINYINIDHFQKKHAFRRPYWRPFYDYLGCDPVIIQNILQQHIL